MTQVFDPDDGHVERVTVIEAGPCFVTAIRRAERDGYDAIQVAFGETREKKLSKPQLGHLKKAGVGILKHLAEFRGEPGARTLCEPCDTGPRWKLWRLIVPAKPLPFETPETLTV